MMKTKKALTLLLALAMLLALCACGSGSAADTAPTVTASENDTAAEETADTAPVGEPIKLIATCAFGETDLASRTLERFCDLIEEKSGGAITFERWLGGTFCSLPEEFGYVSSGAVDCAFLLSNVVLEELPLWNVTLAGFDVENSNEVFDYIYFENEETAAYAAQEAANNNLKILGQITGGTTLHVATSPIGSYDDLKSKLFGCDLNSDVWRSIGFNVQSMGISELYESLSRGVVEAACGGLTNVYSNKLYEVAPYLLFDSHGEVGPLLSMNLETYNGLSEDLQKAVDEAAQEVLAWYTEQYAAESEEIINEMLDSGCTIEYVGEEDVRDLITAIYSLKSETLLPIAENAGCADEFNAILRSTVDYLGITID